MARLDRQICETQGCMAQTFTACEQHCSDDIKLLRIEQAHLEVNRRSTASCCRDPAGNVDGSYVIPCPGDCKPLTSEMLSLSLIPGTQCHAPEGPNAGIDTCLHTVHDLQEVLGKQGEEAERLTRLLKQEGANDVAGANHGLCRAQHTMTSAEEEV